MRYTSEAATQANIAAASTRAPITVQYGDVRALDFPSASFDLVTSSLVLHNIGSAPEREAAVSEMYRVLRPGGRLRIGLPAHRCLHRHAQQLGCESSESVEAVRPDVPAGPRRLSEEAVAR